MNDPRPPDLEALLSPERTIEPESAARRARVMARLDSSVLALAVGTAAHAGVSALGTADSVASRLANLVRAKATIAGLALTIGAGAGAAVGYAAGERAAETRRAPVSGASPATASGAPMRSAEQPSPALPDGNEHTATLTVSALPDAPSAPVPSGRTSAPEGRAEAPGRDQSLSTEVAFIQMARTALGRGDNTGALDATEAHRRQYPRGRMAEERESIAIQALVGAHRSVEARARAAEFKAKFPRSILLPAVDMAVQSIP